MTSNETLLLTARRGVRQAVAVLAHVARPAAFYWARCSRTRALGRSAPLFGRNGFREIIRGCTETDQGAHQ